MRGEKKCEINFPNFTEKNRFATSASQPPAPVGSLGIQRFWIDNFFIISAFFDLDIRSPPWSLVG